MKINQVTPTPPVEAMSRQQQRPVEARENVQKAEPLKGVEAHVVQKVQESVGGDEVKDDEVLAEAVKQANKTLGQYNRYIDRQVHDVTKTVMYSIKDRVTNEVIAEFPPKKIQDMIAKMWELAGLFVDEKA